MSTDDASASATAIPTEAIVDDDRRAEAFWSAFATAPAGSERWTDSVTAAWHPEKSIPGSGA